MPKAHLPQKINPFRFAENAVNLHGTLPIHTMSRLITSLVNGEGDVDVKMEFGIDEQGVRFVKGQVEGSLLLQCQRCMQPFHYGIMSGFTFGVVTTEEEAADLSEFYDPILVKEDALLIDEVVEEELIISLPIVPMHPAGECTVKLPFSAGVLDPAEKVEKENPFKVIESLRSKPKQ
jgi:uncharacterized protein